MDWHELEKMKVDALREMAKEKTDLEGVTGLHKDELVAELAKVFGITKPHKVVEGADKAKYKAKIAELKAEIAKAIEAKDRKKIKALRRHKHGVRRALRRHAHLAS